jgi:hypothetical protein
MLKNFARSASTFIKYKKPIVSSQELNFRMQLCKACEWWDAQALKGTGRCKKCGCSTWAKLRMATERCPIGKWEQHLTTQP